MRGGGAEGGGGGRGGAGNGGQRINLRGGRWFVTSLRHSWNSAHPDNVSEVWTCPIVSMGGGPLGKVVCSVHPIGCRSVLTASLFVPSVEADLRHGAISIERSTDCQNTGARYLTLRGEDKVSGTRVPDTLPCAGETKYLVPVQDGRQISNAYSGRDWGGACRTGRGTYRRSQAQVAPFPICRQTDARMGIIWQRFHIRAARARCCTAALSAFDGASRPSAARCNSSPRRPFLRCVSVAFPGR